MVQSRYGLSEAATQASSQAREDPKPETLNPNPQPENPKIPHPNFYNVPRKL